MNLMKDTRHKFALYVFDLSTHVRSVPASLVIDDDAVRHRIGTVLHIQEGESLVLFDRHMHATAVVKSITKKAVTFDVVSMQSHVHYTPEIRVALPLLKREALEMALYGLVEAGASKIQLIETAKSERLKTDAFDRLERVMIAAAEQSKNFSFPSLERPISFDVCLSLLSSTHVPCIFFDPQGQPLYEVIDRYRKEKISCLWCMVGPEGDLTTQEKAKLREACEGLVTFCALTPTILRAWNAATLGVSALRACMTHSSSY